MVIGIHRTRQQPLNSTNLPMREMLYLLVALGLKTTPTSTRLHPWANRRGVAREFHCRPAIESHRRQRMEICLHTTTICGQVRARACLLFGGIDYPVIQQMVQDGWFTDDGGFVPSGAMLRALLAMSAESMEGGAGF